MLLACDLDRTLVPNGAQPESPAARPLLRALAARGDVILAYVSGRHRALVQDAMGEFGLPAPDYVIGDVGTTIYRVDGTDWHAWERWGEVIGARWGGHAHDDLARLFTDLPELRLQERSKQNTYKLSYYTAADLDRDRLLADMQRRLAERGVAASLVWSVDETADEGLLDVLPADATKLDALRFLMAELEASRTETVFAGDSGNDLPVLTSGLQAVLVANATETVRAEARALAARQGVAASLYCAAGGFLGMNGNYSAGVLEGVAHFLPAMGDWLAGAAAELGSET